MSPEYLSSLAGILISLLASYLPGFSPWFGNLDPNFKRLIMLVFLVVAAVGSYGVACAGWVNLVTPRVGAWIETVGSCIYWMSGLCRSPCGGRGLKPFRDTRLGRGTESLPVWGVILPSVANPVCVPSWLFQLPEPTPAFHPFSQFQHWDNRKS